MIRHEQEPVPSRRPDDASGKNVLADRGLPARGRDPEQWPGRSPPSPGSANQPPGAASTRTGDAGDGDTANAPTENVVEGYAFPQIEGGDIAQAGTAVRAFLEGDAVLDRFLARVTAYRRRAFAPTTKRFRIVRIEDKAARVRIGGLAIGVLSRERSPLGFAPDIEVDPVRLVWLSPETAVKQIIHHADLTAADYLRLPDLLEYGEIVAVDGRRFSFFFDFGRGGLYRAVVKQARTNELFLTTFHPAQARNLRSARFHARAGRK